MKKLIILILFFQTCCLLFSLPLTSDDYDNLTANAGISFLFPVDKEFTGSDTFLDPLLLSSVSFGIGYHLDIIRNIFSPGIYGDIHINLIPIAIIFLTGGVPDGYQENTGRLDFPFLLQTGIRLYNQFRFNSFDIQPFIGLNLMAGSIETTVFKKLGILIAYENFGIEYSYQIPFFNGLGNSRQSTHRIVFVYHMR